MAQSDQSVQNATFPSVRADINDNLAALYSQSSGNSAPTVTVAFQPWVDTSSSPPVWKVRNGSNSAWITIGILDPAGFNAGGITAIANGGTGAATATAAINALIPSQTGNSGKLLTTNGTAVSWGAVGSNPKIDIFASSTTWTCPTGVTQVIVSVVGGGGGGGGNEGNESGGTGGVGGAGIGILTVTPATVYTITVGAGGGGGSGGGAGGNGAAGGTSNFGPQGGTVLISATGGGGASGGYNGNTGSDGAAGTCSSTSANLRRANVSAAAIPYIAGGSITNGSGGPVVWSVAAGASPGSRGQGGSPGNAGAGGYGGVILIEYWSQ